MFGIFIQVDYQSLNPKPKIIGPMIEVPLHALVTKPSVKLCEILDTRLPKVFQTLCLLKKGVAMTILLVVDS
jgi:hypothetical protein